MVACVIGVFFLSVIRPLFSGGGPIITADLCPLFPGLSWPFHPGPNSTQVRIIGAFKLEYSALLQIKQLLT